MPSPFVVGSIMALARLSHTGIDSLLVSRLRSSALEQALAEISPDEMSPKAALEALYKLKGLIAKDRT